MENIYEVMDITETVNMSFIDLEENFYDLASYFKQHAARHIQGKCRQEGYVKRIEDIGLKSISVGVLKADQVCYTVVYEASVCCPKEGNVLECIVKNITKIGIRAVVSEVNNPIVVFISREHNDPKKMDEYQTLDQPVRVKVIATMFELNDPSINVIGEIV
jgi:DNA-directed RNA polymerase subunit E'/Rpb7